MHSKASLQWLVVLRLRIDLSDGPVARDNQLAWPDLLEREALPFAGKGIVVRPHLQVRCRDLRMLACPAKVIYDDNILVSITAPPLVMHLDEGARVLRPGVSGLASPSGAHMPLIYEE